MNPDAAPLCCLLAMLVTLVWFSVLTYRDMRKLTARMNDYATKDHFEYTNARHTHLVEYLKAAGILKPLTKRR